MAIGLEKREYHDRVIAIQNIYILLERRRPSGAITYFTREHASNDTLISEYLSIGNNALFVWKVYEAVLAL